MAALRLRTHTDPLNYNRRYIVFGPADMDLLRPEFFRIELWWGENSGTKSPKIVLKMVHPEQPTRSSELYHPLFECDVPVRVRASDVAIKSDGVKGKTSWLFPAPRECVNAMRTLADAVRWELTSRETAHVWTKVTRKGGAGVSFELKSADKPIAEWAFNHREGQPFFKEVCDELGIAKGKLGELDDEEYDAFRKALCARVSAPRTPDADDDDKEGKRPWFKPLVIAKEGDEGEGSLPPAVAISLKNFKAGEKQKKTATNEDLEQTVIKEVTLQPDGTWDTAHKTAVSVDHALEKTTYSSNGTGRDGAATAPFIFEAKMRWSFKWYWINAKGANPTLALDTLEYALLPSTGSIFDRDIGVEQPAAKRAKVEHHGGEEEEDS